MIKLKYKLLLFLAIGISVTLHASEPTIKKEFTREIHETFNVSSGVNLSVENKYGNLNITTWDKNQIQIDVLIKVKSSDSNKAEKFLKDVKIDFQSTLSKVEAKTVYQDEENNSWWSNWFGSGKNVDFEVHYTIHAPIRINTSLVNKYGNISQSSIEGECNVINKFGDISFENVSGKLKLDLGYGKATIGEVGDTEMEIKYSSIKVIKTGDIKMSSKYSDIKIKFCENMIADTKHDEYVIEQMNSLKNDGKYDDFRIGTINQINIDTKYSDINITTLNHQGIFNTGYGSINVKSSGRNLEKIAIEAKYTDYVFGIIGDFNLDFEGSNTDLHISQPYEKYNSNKDGSDLKLKAYRGSKTGGADISVYMKYGGLTIN